MSEPKDTNDASVESVVSECVDYTFDPNATNCVLCGDSGTVEIIPHDGTNGNDSREDECPHCLRRKIGPSPLQFALKEIRLLQSFLDTAERQYVRAGGSRDFRTEDGFEAMKKKLRRAEKQASR